ncbi:MAG: hypothetical protein ACXWDI_07490 [Nocardioides sp.]
MSTGLLTALATATTVVVLLVVVVLAVLLARALSGRRRLEDSLAASLEELATVQRRLDALARRVEPRPVVAETEYVITTAGEPDPADLPVAATPMAPVSAGQFASVAAGESLVRLVSLGYGVRRALSEENRNRIGFEMRREVRRSRKQRKREVKQARRFLRETSMTEDAA